MAPASNPAEKKGGKSSEATPVNSDVDIVADDKNTRRKLRPRENLKRPSDTPMNEIPAKKPSTQRSKALETIFEEPAKKNGKTVLFSAYKRIRALKFPDCEAPPTAAKQKQRLLKIKSLKGIKKPADKA